MTNPTPAANSEERVTLPIVERLRDASTFCGPLSDVNHLFEEAADTIETLKRQRLTILAAVYREAPRFVETISCEIDPTGTLIREVRDTSDAAFGGGPQ